MDTTVITPAQLKLLHLVFGGESVIDWHGLEMDEPARVEKFLTLNAYDISNKADRKRLGLLVKASFDYLTHELDFPLSSPIRDISDIRQFFYIASGRSKNPRQAMEACAVLKTVHIINHLEGRQLLFHFPAGLEALYDLVWDKIEKELSALKEKSFSTLRVIGDKKSRSSMVTKLLAKKATIAAEINDRLRFRLVVNQRSEIVPLVLALFENILPFNYVIPGESANDLVGLPPLQKKWPSPLELARKTIVTGLHAAEERFGLITKLNTFTGPSYQVVQFVVDVPFHLDATKGALTARAAKDYGAIVYTKVEFQIVDRKTEQANNTGQNSHDQYKTRQRLAVLKRLVET